MKVTQSCPALCDPTNYTVLGILQARILEWVALPFSRGSSQPRDQTQVFSIAGDSLPAEPPGKSKNTGMGSLTLLLEIFPIHQWNLGLLHCRWILYQLSYEGSPYMQSTSCKMLGWMKLKLESKLPGEISITSDMQMTPTLWQKVKRN